MVLAGRLWTGCDVRQYAIDTDKSRKGVENSCPPAYTNQLLADTYGSSSQIQITEEDLHVHLKARMSQRGVTKEEIERTLSEGWEATDARSGTLGKIMIFPYQKEWEGRFYEEKEVTVYYKFTAGIFALLTVKARYGKNFPRGD
jgi:hypothetical protein